MESELSIKDYIYLAVFLLAAFFLFKLSLPALIFLLLVFAFVVFIAKPDLILYLTAALSLPIGLRLSLARFSWIREDFPALAALNAPWVDFIALFGLGVLTVVSLLKIKGYSFSALVKKDYCFKYYLPFLLSGFISAWLVFAPGMINDSLYYVVRNLLFVYLAFVVLPVALIDDRDTLERVLWVLFWSGFAVACFGGIAFIRDLTFGGWPRVVPFSIYSWAPLKYNHNILAESLVAVVPAAVYLSATRNKAKIKRWMFAATSFIVLVCVLTLSRAAWLSLSVQGVLALFVFKERVKNLFKRRKELKYLLIAGLVPSVGYMLYFLTSHVITSSNVWRIEVLKIVWFYFQDSPFFGYGPGTFLTMLEQVKSYVINFGEPLDAHGFVQKILLEQGVIGLAAFGSFLSAVFYKVWRRQRGAHIDRLMLAALLISAVGAVFFQLFNTSYYNVHMWLPIGLALAGANVVKDVRF
ncbi:MAG: O-antigen ligase family protein [Candidatus Paceibacteria bacterium]